MVAQAIQQDWQELGVQVTLVPISYEVLPEIKEYERTSTTVVNAYVMPVVSTYLRALRKGLDGAGIPAELRDRVFDPFVTS